MKKLIISLTLGLTLVGSPVLAAEATTASPAPAGDTTVTTTTAPADQTTASTPAPTGDQAVSTTPAPVTDSTATAPENTTTTTTTAAPTGEAAAPATTVPDAGLTPDSPFYFIDKFLEKIQLALVSEENKAQLLDEFAQERLSEAQAVPEASVKADLLNEYIATVDQVKILIDKQVSTSNNAELINSVKLGSTRGLTVLKDLAAANPNPGLLNAIDKQETKLAEHLIFAELKQQFKANNQAMEALEKQIAEAKAAGQDVTALEAQLKDLQAKADVLKDSKKLIKGLRKELKQQMKTNEDEFEKFIQRDMEKYEENDEDELKIEDNDQGQDQDQDKAADIQKDELKEKIKLEKKKAHLEKKALKEQFKKERKEKEKEDRENNKELKKHKQERDDHQDRDDEHDNDGERD